MHPLSREVLRWQYKLVFEHDLVWQTGLENSRLSKRFVLGYVLQPPYEPNEQFQTVTVGTQLIVRESTAPPSR